MKKITIGILVLLSLFVGGCTELTKKTILFDGYQIELSTANIYQEIKANIPNGEQFIKQYLQNTQTGFASSIIIAKKQTQSGTNISNFIANNSKSIIRKIPGANNPSKNNISFECGSIEIEGIIQKTEIEQGKTTQYLNQFYFINSGYIYGISTMTTDKKEHKNLSQSIKTILCY